MRNKVNVKKFCDDSTVHGFKELYYSKHGAMKTFWTMVIVGAIGITVYQIYDAVATYQEQPTVINVHPLEEEILPPDINICFDFRYVLSWMSFTTLNKLDVETDRSFFHFLCRMIGYTFDCYSTFANTNFSGKIDFNNKNCKFLEFENAYYKHMEKQHISNDFYSSNNSLLSLLTMTYQLIKLAVSSWNQRKCFLLVTILINIFVIPIQLTTPKVYTFYTFSFGEHF